MNKQKIFELSQVHPQWHDILGPALDTLDKKYLQGLVSDSCWLPGMNNLFAAFRRNFENTKYILIGESPYPRANSANGIAFFDAAVDSLWSETGLSKAVNRATSMRNILKTALLAEKLLTRDSDGKVTQQKIAEVDKSKLVQTMPNLFNNLSDKGFLMLNATPVLHPDRKPIHEARQWIDFLEQLLIGIKKQLLKQHSNQEITLLLWGKIATSVELFSICAQYRRLTCEHPYNISFIENTDMQNLFEKIKMLQA